MGYMPPPPKPIEVDKQDDLLLKRILKKKDIRYTLEYKDDKALFTIRLIDESKREELTARITEHYQSEKDICSILESTGAKIQRKPLKEHLKTALLVSYHILLLGFILYTPYWLNKIAFDLNSTIPIWIYTALNVYAVYEIAIMTNRLERYYEKIGITPAHVFLSAGSCFVSIVLLTIIKLAEYLGRPPAFLF